MATATNPLAPRLTPYIRELPHPAQQAFLLLGDMGVDEALYGGAAGGGKSKALLMAALQYVDVPGYDALLLRRTMPDLEQAEGLIPLSKEWLSGLAEWNDNKHRWTFPSGATLRFGHMQHEDDKLRYQGGGYNFAGFDELTQFSETQYAYLASRIRRPDRSTGLAAAWVPGRLRGASNPGGPGHKWVRRRFIDKLPRPDDPEDTPEKCAARVFIPARVIDNPSLDYEDYVKKLGALDPQTRKQLLDGDWNAREPGDWVFPEGLDQVFAYGAKLDAERDQIVPVDSQVIICADWGVHAHILILWPLEAGGFYAVKEIVNDVASIRTVAPRVADEILALQWPVYSERFDASMPGLNDAFMQALKGVLPWPIKPLGVPFGKFKALTIDYLRLLAANTLAGEIAPRLAISEQGCPVLAEQIRGWKYADPDAGRTEKGDDHGPDALVAGVAPVAAKRRRKRA